MSRKVVLSVILAVSSVFAQNFSFTSASRLALGASSTSFQNSFTPFINPAISFNEKSISLFYSDNDYAGNRYNEDMGYKTMGGVLNSDKIGNISLVYVEQQRSKFYVDNYDHDGYLGAYSLGYSRKILDNLVAGCRLTSLNVYEKLTKVDKDEHGNDRVQNTSKLLVDFGLSYKFEMVNSDNWKSILQLGAYGNNVFRAKLNADNYYLGGDIVSSFNYGVSNEITYSNPIWKKSYLLKFVTSVDKSNFNTHNNTMNLSEELSIIDLLKFRIGYCMPNNSGNYTSYGFGLNFDLRRYATLSHPIILNVDFASYSVERHIKEYWSGLNNTDVVEYERGKSIAVLTLGIKYNI